jgi:hypothetical protein
MAGSIDGRSFAGPYQVTSVRGAAETVRAECIFQMGGGKRTRSTCNKVATAKAYFGNLCSIQQLRKYGSPRNFFGVAGPRTNASRLE